VLDLVAGRVGRLAIDGSDRAVAILARAPLRGLLAEVELLSPAAVDRLLVDDGPVRTDKGAGGSGRR